MTAHRVTVETAALERTGGGTPWSAEFQDI